ncbi:hypothetical protein ACQRIT_003674 [Beauveria bassiana]
MHSGAVDPSPPKAASAQYFVSSGRYTMLLMFVLGRGGLTAKHVVEEDAQLDAVAASAWAQVLHHLAVENERLDIDQYSKQLNPGASIAFMRALTD